MTLLDIDMSTVSGTVLKKNISIAHQRCIVNTSTSTAMCNEQQERLLHDLLLVRSLVLRMGGIDSDDVIQFSYRSQ